MSSSDPIPALREFLRSELLQDDTLPALEPDTNLLAEGGLDSMGVVRLVAFVEQRFQIQVPAEDVTLENFQSLRAIVDYLRRRSP